MNQVYSVGQVNSYIKNMFQTDYALNSIYIKGEVSNCKYHSSGHIYFTLKDKGSAIACVMFAGNRNAGLKFRLLDGQSVVAGGSISVYERDGRYQLYAKDLLLDGAGALYAEYERLKQMLYEEGLFDHEIKQEIPKYPKRVGIVTAATGAAIQDIQNIAKRRNPYVQLILYPAVVQGEGAAATIAKGIETLDRMQVDTIIIGRGGGSIEDLWAFNEEIVARAIFRAKTPIISGTGHETDTTIADYAADLRAPTPSAACELAIPDVRQMLDAFAEYQQRLTRLQNYRMERFRHRLTALRMRLQFQSPANQLHEKQLRLSELSDRIQMAVHRRLENRQHLLAIYTEKLNGVSPTAKLINGFGYVSDEKQEPVNAIKDVAKGDLLTITMLDGSCSAKVTSVHPAVQIERN